MWIALGSAAGLLVGLVVGFWTGHRFGYGLCREDIAADGRVKGVKLAEKLKGFDYRDQSVENVLWCYRELLHREPSNEEASNWARNKWPINQLASVFIATPEYKSLPPERQKQSQARMRERTSPQL